MTSVFDTKVTVDFPLLARLLDDLKQVTQDDISKAEPKNLGERDQTILGECTQEEKTMVALYAKLKNEHRELHKGGKCPGGHEYIEMVWLLANISMSQRFSKKNESKSMFLFIVAGWKIVGKEREDLFSLIEGIMSGKIK